MVMGLPWGQRTLVMGVINLTPDSFSDGGRFERPEQALAQARDALEATEAQLKEVEQERMTSEQKLGPLRDRINEVKLKEQEARINEEQYAQQLVEAGANEEALAQLVEKGQRSG
jgi:chromosome segregation protein